MYIDFKRIGFIVLRILAVLMLAYGLISYAVAPAVSTQTLGIQTAIFGLLALWYMAWRGGPQRRK